MRSQVTTTSWIILLLVRSDPVSCNNQQSSLFDIFFGDVGKYLVETKNSLYGPRVQDPAEDEEVEEYDFIIVGAGVAGSVVANRLTEIPDWKVLLLEAGIPENPISEVPQFSQILQLTQYNWRYHTVPQQTGCSGMIDEKCHVASGRGLGGGGAISDGTYSRGTKRDYDRWAEEVDSDDWNFENVLQYHKKAEDVHLRIFDWDYHGLGGPINVEDLRNPSRIRQPFLNAARELDYKILDYNGENQLGFSRTQVNTKLGRRHSISKAYLESVRDRKNLIIKTVSNVTRILIDPETKRTDGVEYVRNGRKLLAKNRKDVIVSAGAFNSPQLLMISGIGPKRHLEQMDIECLRDLAVGENLRDHIAFMGLNFIYKQKLSQENQLLNFYDWLVRGEGPLTTTGTDALGLIHSGLSEDPDRADIELGLTPYSLAGGYDLLQPILNVKREIYDSIWKDVEGDDGFNLMVVLLRSQSVGSIKLRSKDIKDHPLIDPNYLSNPIDVEIILEGIRKGLELIGTDSFKRSNAELNDRKVYGCESHDFATDDYWRCAIPKLQISTFHYSGTNRMGGSDDPKAVVDDRLKVKGVGRLRVIDASVIPNAITGYMLGPVVMLGEKGSDIVKEDWNAIARKK